MADGDATTYSISLLAGSTTLNTVNGSNSTIPLGQFAKVTPTYTTGSTVTPGDLSINLTSGGTQIDFDAVSLTASGGVYYYVEDMLGTSRVITTTTGAVCYDADFYPFGGERTYTSTYRQNYGFKSAREPEERYPGGQGVPHSNRRPIHSRRQVFQGPGAAYSQGSSPSPWRCREGCRRFWMGSAGL